MRILICVTVSSFLAFSACTNAGKKNTSGSSLANPSYSSHYVNGQNPVQEYISRKKRQAEAGITLYDIAGLGRGKVPSLYCVDFGSKCFVEYKNGDLTQEELQTAAQRVCEDEHSIVSSSNVISGAKSVPVDGITFEFNCILKVVAKRG